MESSAATDGETCYSSSDEEKSGRFGVTQFTEDTILTFSADEFIEIDSAIIKQNQLFMLMDVQSTKIGNSEFQIRGTDLSSTFSLQSHTTDPTSFALTFPETTLPNTNALLAVQVLDSGGNPVYAKEDIEIILVSNNESVIDIPESLVIAKDEYRTIFEITTKGEGGSEIALLSEDLPLAKFDLNVKGIIPKINMNIAGSGLVSEAMTVTLSVSYPGVGLTAEGMDVEWSVTGAEIMNQRQITDANGLAVLEVISYNPSTAKISAVVNGVGVSNAISSASYTFEYPEGYVEILESDNQGLGGIIMENTQLLYLIAPVAAVGAIFFLKRTNRLEGITERLPLDGLAEKFDGIKEKISDIRERD
jgi:hypothetical protein